MALLYGRAGRFNGQKRRLPARADRDQMVNSPAPDELGPAGQLTERRQLLPVLTACTYGQMDEVDVFAGTLHAFAGGASGFSFFAGNCFVRAITAWPTRTARSEFSTPPPLLN